MEERRELGMYCFCMLKVWNFYFIMLTFVSHLTSPKMLATINLRPVLMMTKKCWTAKMFTEIIHVFPNATTPEQHNLKFTNTLQCVICHLDFRTSWMCFTESIALICLSYSKLIFFAVLKTSILNHYRWRKKLHFRYRIFPFLIIYIIFHNLLMSRMQVNMLFMRGKLYYLWCLSNLQLV